MGDYPAFVDGVAVETAAKLVIDSAEGHLIQGLVDDDVQPVLAGGVVSGEGKLDGGGVREFRGASEAAVDYVEALTYGLEGGVDGRVLEEVAFLALYGELSQVLLNLAGVFQGGVPVVPVEVADPGEEGLVAGPAVHVVLGEVGAAVEDLTLVGEEGGEGPAALARDGADGALVAAVDLGPFVPVDLNGDESGR